MNPEGPGVDPVTLGSDQIDGIFVPEPDLENPGVAGEGSRLGRMGALRERANRFRTADDPVRSSGPRT